MTTCYQNNGITYFNGACQVASDYLDRYKGRIGVVIGNGKSRLKYDLFDLRMSSKVPLLFACNNYFEDALNGVQPIPDFLGAVDPHISEKILSSNYADKYNFLTSYNSLTWYRSHNKVDPVIRENLIEWDYNINFNCGVEMAQFAILAGCSEVYLVGFDGPSEAVNNVYEGRTCCFATPETPAPGRNQMRTVVNYFDIPVYQVGTDWLTVPRVDSICG